MCIGIPMQVVSYEGGHAWCRSCVNDQAETPALKQINMQLVGELPPGSWVLTFLGSAREELTELAAMRTHNAIQAVEMVMRGEPQGTQQLRHLFADLIDREPQLPTHLQQMQD